MIPATNNTIEAIAKDECKLCEIHKHPFGILIIYVQFAVALLAAFGLILFLAPQFISDGTKTSYGVLFSLVGVVVVAVVALLLILVTYIYRQNKLIITDRNVTQISQRGLFSRQVSELSMASVEDVSSEQRGFFATIFGYGTVKIETAGEQNNFHFTYCPRPNYYGKVVLDARQKYVTQNPEHNRTA